MPLLALACLAVFAGCKPEDPAPFEAERAQLLASTVPRDEYWKEVEHKGSALKDQRAAEQRSARANAERAQLTTSIDQLRTQVEDAKRTNQSVVEHIQSLSQQEEKLRERQRLLESFLARTGPPDVAAPAK